MPLINWSDEYNIKIPEIDKEHKVLSRMINCLHESMLTGKDCKVVNEMAGKLVSSTEKHFKNEEKLMIRDNFSDTVSHKFSHDKLLLQLKELIEDICTDDIRDVNKTALLDDWFVDHLLIEDKKYGLSQIKSKEV